MKTLELLVIIFAAGMIAGCDSISRHQYVIPNATPVDYAAVCELGSATARSLGFKDVSSKIGIDGVPCAFVQDVAHFPVEIGARVHERSAVVDIRCFHPGAISRAPAMFAEIDRVLYMALLSRFGPRLIRDPVPAVPFTSNPPNQALEPTTLAVTIPAAQEVAPARVVAHL